MKKILLISVFLFFLFPQPARASLITVNQKGEVVLKVLSSQDEIALGIPKRDFLEVKEMAVGLPAVSNPKISLQKSEGKVLLKVQTDSSQTSLDVSGWTEDVVEIEEREETKKLAIAIKKDKFSIKQEGVVVLTDYPISINPQKNQLSVETPSGNRFLSILPIEAAQSLLRARIISRLFLNNEAVLTENERGELIYVISGEKTINLFNLFDYSVPVTAQVSALTGEVVLVDQPVWLKILGFLFS